MDIIGISKAAYYSFCGLITSVLLYFMPLQGLVIAISIAFTANFIFGILTGLLVQKETVSFKKAFIAFCEVAVYMVILTQFYTIGDKMKSPDTVFKMVSMLTWAWITFYSANLSKNLKRLFPHSRGFNFLFYVLNLEFIKRIPYLKKFEEYEKN